MRCQRTLLLVVFLVSCAVVAVAAPQAELWPRWQAHDPSSTESIDHSDWGSILDEYLIANHPSGINRVDYAAVSAMDKETLDEYVAMLEAVEVSSLDRDEQLAYWLNLYNAATVQLVLDNYPVESIRDIKSGAFGSGPWDIKLLTVEAEEVSLNDIEHRIIRPIWQDNRIHYVVNCASIGCPNLYPEPITAENWNRVFDESAYDYIQHPRGVRFEGNRLVLSSIYDWYVADFDGDVDGVIDHVTEYTDSEIRERLQGFDGRVRYEYDWSLNEP
jgi:hypothetical protein